MNKEKPKKAVSVFVFNSKADVWAEYVAVYTYSGKLNKPIKFLLSLVWRSSSKVSFSAGIRGSFASEQEASEFMRKALSQGGSEVQKMTKKSLAELEKKYGYPNGRHPYILEKAII